MCVRGVRAFTVHCHQQNSSPSAPSCRVLTHGRSVSAGLRTYTRRGSIDTTTACAPYACTSMQVVRQRGIEVRFSLGRSMTCLCKWRHA